jgi:two-component system, LytTR family, sensor kinase
MQAVELKISIQDWVYIGIIGVCFGFFLSLFFYFLNDIFSHFSTIVFGISTALCITLFSFLFITVSNNYILPELDEKLWYIISFIFSFLSGSLGFLFTYSIFYLFDTTITSIIEPYSLYLTLTVGFLSFLMGFIFHQFIVMKYKNESIRNEILTAKIKALENELNPHFLFNALNSMSELVYINRKKAEESILNLSKFLRNAIKIDSLIDIRNELDMVQNYVDIENIRFDDKIKLHITKSNTKEIKLPKFSIQLLVENAIKHGYTGKLLNIYIDIDDDIYFSNDGKVSKNIKFGTGLSNLNNRLKLLNIGKIRFESSDTMKFKIEVHK